MLAKTNFVKVTKVTANDETINKMLYDKTAQAQITELTRIYQSRPPLSWVRINHRKLEILTNFPALGSTSWRAVAEA